ncbi:MAG: DUF5615 family PIN-like protein [Anaerolineae bacterium]|nr:DUF5615 family PIN-like protein [Anaerolineae bacterium]
MNAVRYLLDEHVDPLYRTELLKREPSMTIWRIGILGAPPKGTLDPDILRWCEENAFILVTNNRKSMPRHLQDHLDEGRHVPGIFELNPKMGVGETIEELLMIWAASQPDEYRDRIIYLPL